jgi:hypothetical protein
VRPKPRLLALPVPVTRRSADAASEQSRASPTLEICMLIIMHIFSIMVIMQIVKRHGEKNGLFAGTEG